MWVEATNDLSDGQHRVRWPDGYIALERILGHSGEACILQSHRGVLFYGPVHGQGLSVEVPDPPPPPSDGPPDPGNELPPGVEPPPPPPPPPGNDSPPPPGEDTPSDAVAEGEPQEVTVQKA